MMAVAMVAVLCAIVVAFLKVRREFQTMLLMVLPVLLAIPSMILGLVAALADD
jgi:ABC-type phosphate transport system permease subunit